jgi:hypothetical protein
LAKITFGILALNAQPFLEYSLRALYPFAHEIIVVEGATRAAVSLAGADGHSTDNTLKMLSLFGKQEDPQKKIRVISAADDGYADGFWPEKDEMSQAFATRATGDWLWQVDSDEFYREDDIRKICNLLEGSNISGISFPFREFWGGFDYLTTGAWYLYEFTGVPRVFQWRSGYSYKSHRPPTVVDEKGAILDPSKWLSGKQMKNQDIFMHHYSYVFPKQAEQKVGYYANVDWTDAFKQNARWMREEYYDLRHPMFLGERGWPVLQWLERYSGQHPAAIQRLRADLVSGKILENMRPTEDIDRLLNSPLYFLERVTGRVFLAIYWPLRVLWKRVRSSLFGGVNVR